MDFAKARIGAVHPDAVNAVGPVRGIRVGQFKPDVARVVVDLAGAVPYRVETSDGSVTVVFGAASANTTSAPAAAKEVPANDAPKSVAVTVPAAVPVAASNVKPNLPLQRKQVLCLRRPRLR